MFECMVLLPLYGNNVHVLVQSISIFMYMFMGLVARIDDVMVASSSPVGGSGTLQCG